MSKTLDLKETLLSRIKKNYFPGKKIWSESQLHTKYKFSRTTIRNVLKQLVNEKVLLSIKGKGYFVNDLKKWQRPISFAEKHPNTNFKILKTTRTLDPWFIQNYSLVNLDFLNVTKLRFKNRKIHKYSVIWINKKICGNPKDLEEIGSILNFLKKRTILSRNERKIFLRPANSQDWKFLKTKKGVFIPQKNSVTFNEDNEVVECSIEVYRPEQWECWFTESF